VQPRITGHHRKVGDLPRKWAQEKIMKFRTSVTLTIKVTMTIPGDHTDKPATWWGLRFNNPIKGDHCNHNTSIDNISVQEFKTTTDKAIKELNLHKKIISSIIGPEFKLVANKQMKMISVNIGELTVVCVTIKGSEYHLNYTGYGDKTIVDMSDPSSFDQLKKHIGEYLKEFIDSNKGRWNKEHSNKAKEILNQWDMSYEDNSKEVS
jgi:hypothetical protein